MESDRSIQLYHGMSPYHMENSCGQWSEDTTFNRLMKTKTATHKNERSIEYHVLAVYVHFDRLIRIFGCFSNFQS